MLCIAAEQQYYLLIINVYSSWLINRVSVKLHKWICIMKNNVHVIISITFCFLAEFGQSLYSMESSERESGMFPMSVFRFSCGTQQSNIQFIFCDTLVLLNHGPHHFPSISETLAKTNHKSRSKSHLYFPPPCNHLTKENISYWFKIVLRNSILSEETLMHFHIKLILSLRKMKTQSLFMQKELTVSSSSINASVYLGRERMFMFFTSFFWHCTRSEEPKPSCPSLGHIARLEGMSYPQTRNT